MASGYSSPVVLLATDDAEAVSVTKAAVADALLHTWQLQVAATSSEARSLCSSASPGQHAPGIVLLQPDMVARDMQLVGVLRRLLPSTPLVLTPGSKPLSTAFGTDSYLEAPLRMEEVRLLLLRLQAKQLLGASSERPSAQKRTPEAAAAPKNTPSPTPVPPKSSRTQSPQPSAAQLQQAANAASWPSSAPAGPVPAPRPPWMPNQPGPGFAWAPATPAPLMPVDYLAMQQRAAAPDAAPAPGPLGPARVAFGQVPSDVSLTGGTAALASAVAGSANASRSADSTSTSTTVGNGSTDDLSLHPRAGRAGAQTPTLVSAPPSPFSLAHVQAWQTHGSFDAWQQPPASLTSPAAAAATTAVGSPAAAGQHALPHATPSTPQRQVPPASPVASPVLAQLFQELQQLQQKVLQKRRGQTPAAVAPQAPPSATPAPMPGPAAAAAAAAAAASTPGAAPEPVAPVPAAAPASQASLAPAALPAGAAPTVMAPAAGTGAGDEGADDVVHATLAELHPRPPYPTLPYRLHSRHASHTSLALSDLATWEDSSPMETLSLEDIARISSRRSGSLVAPGADSFSLHSTPRPSTDYTHGWDRTHSSSGAAYHPGRPSPLEIPGADGYMSPRSNSFVSTGSGRYRPGRRALPAAASNGSLEVVDARSHSYDSYPASPAPGETLGDGAGEGQDSTSTAQQLSRLHRRSDPATPEQEDGQREQQQQQQSAEQEGLQHEVHAQQLGLGQAQCEPPSPVFQQQKQKQEDQLGGDGPQALHELGSHAHPLDADSAGHQDRGPPPHAHHHQHELQVPQADAQEGQWHHREHAHEQGHDQHRQDERGHGPREQQQQQQHEVHIRHVDGLHQHQQQQDQQQQQLLQQEVHMRHADGPHQHQQHQDRHQQDQQQRQHRGQHQHQQHHEASGVTEAQPSGAQPQVVQPQVVQPRPLTGGHSSSQAVQQLLLQQQDKPVDSCSMSAARSSCAAEDATPQLQAGALHSLLPDAPVHVTAMEPLPAEAASSTAAAEVAATVHTAPHAAGSSINASAPPDTASSELDLSEHAAAGASHDAPEAAGSCDVHISSASGGGGDATNDQAEAESPLAARYSNSHIEAARPKLSDAPDSSQSAVSSLLLAAARAAAALDDAAVEVRMHWRQRGSGGEEQHQHGHHHRHHHHPRHHELPQEEQKEAKGLPPPPQQQQQHHEEQQQQQQQPDAAVNSAGSELLADELQQLQQNVREHGPQPGQNEGNGSSVSAQAQQQDQPSVPAEALAALPPAPSEPLTVQPAAPPPSLPSQQQPQAPSLPHEATGMLARSHADDAGSLLLPDVQLAASLAAWKQQQLQQQQGTESTAAEQHLQDEEASAAAEEAGPNGDDQLARLQQEPTAWGSAASMPAEAAAAEVAAPASPSTLAAAAEEELDVVLAGSPPQAAAQPDQQLLLQDADPGFSFSKLPDVAAVKQFGAGLVERATAWPAAAVDTHVGVDWLQAAAGSAGATAQPLLTPAASFGSHDAVHGQQAAALMGSRGAGAQALRRRAARLYLASHPVALDDGW